MKRSAALLMMLILTGCATRSTMEVTPMVTQAVPEMPRPTALAEPVRPQGRVESREAAIELATLGQAEGDWDAVLVEDYAYPFDYPKTGEPLSRTTWIVQKLYPGPNQTFFVDAQTGEVYLARSTHAPSPVALPKTEQGAVDLLFQAWGDDPEVEPFPRTIGTREADEAIYETSASAAAKGSYEVRLVRRWETGGKAYQRTWTFRVGPDGLLSSPVVSGDQLPASAP